ncbi:hypothetical protein [Spirosoma profusum]|uniref:hypothetical protein n=1 Tax=Spirosoma profusum TaxID=2771354 RepID=UPI001683ED7A|nr:hypothetical protein [Spirosoma profusum]
MNVILWACTFCASITDKLEPARKVISTTYHFRDFWPITTLPVLRNGQGICWGNVA